MKHVIALVFMFFLLSSAAVSADEPISCVEQITRSVLDVAPNEAASITGIKQIYGNVWGTYAQAYVVRVSYDDGRVAQQQAEYLVVVDTGTRTSGRTRCKVRFRSLVAETK